MNGLQLSPPLAGYEITALKLAFQEKAILIRRFAAAKSEITFQAAYFSSTGPRLDTLMRAFERSFSAALDEAELWRVLLIFYSGFLLVILAWFAWRLTGTLGEIRRINLALKEANESLEQRVAERTKELSETLDRLKESEAMLVQSEKMSSLGQMVAGLAHEVNTPLAYVKSSLDAVRGQIANTGRLATEVDHIAGIKDSSGNLSQTAEYLRRTPDDFRVLMGRDTLIYAALAHGAVGAIAASANLAPDLSVGIYEGYVAGDLKGALEFQLRLAPLRNAFSLGTFPAVLKTGLELLGLPAGPPRAPVSPLTADERERLRSVLAKAGKVEALFASAGDVIDDTTLETV